MFIQFFFALRDAGVPVSLREHLTLLEAMVEDVPDHTPESFYYLARAALVKDERHLDRFDVTFAKVFEGALSSNGQAFIPDEVTALPEDWLRAAGEKYLSEEEKAEIEALGGWDKLMQTLAERLKEQKDRHQGGSKWIGTGGTSPFGHSGYHPEGVRIGGKSTHRRAVKVWDKREFQNLDDDREIGTRTIKVALRKLRRFARTGTPDEVDLGGTIDATAKSGYLDVKMRAPRKNAVKVLLLFDIGGSMDDHVTICEELFSAARSAFKHLEFYYFHNMIYDYVWKNNQRRWTEKTPLEEVLRTYGKDYVVIFVGDASMSPYEITMAGGASEYFNAEPGYVWMTRLADHFQRIAWLNPVPKEHWGYTTSIDMVQKLVAGRMYPLTLGGLDDAMSALRR